MKGTNKMLVDYSFLNNNAKKVLESILEYEIEQLLGEVEHTKSPIEEILYLALNYEIRDIPGFYIHAQRMFVLNDKTYYADMAIEIAGTGKYVCIVECDGHDFHERTKEQAKRDRSRDRAFQSAGIPVFRFTGSEIYADSLKCAREVEIFLRNLL